MRPLYPSRPRALTIAIMGVLCPALAYSADAPNGAEPFTLGTIVIIGKRIQVGDVGDDQIAAGVSQAEMTQFNRATVGEALNLLSGVTIATNSRNEKTLSVRGFDSRQVPLFIDGIPVYVPYDGYVDFDRFTTADLAAIQVAKGFSSVAYGANTLGGAINLVSRRPSAKLEGDVSAGVSPEGGQRAAVNVGSNQGFWYVQGGVAHDESDGFRLSSDFTPTATEDGRRRDNAYHKDNKLSFKIGLTPTGGDEYALSYYQQEGEKGQPPSTNPAQARYWQWPMWDKESLYFVSRTALGDSELLQLRLYHDSYDNEVDSYTDGSYSVLKTSGSGSVGTGRSIYHDRTQGGSVELSSDRFKRHDLRLVGHYKTDRHEELDGNSQVNATFEDGLMSLGAEDSIELRADLSLSLGLSRHRLSPDTVFSRGNAYSLPDAKTANDAQAGLYYVWTDTARLYATLAKKSRLPTLKDRYSQRLGTYIENPDLQPERAINYEIGYQGTPWSGGKAEAAIFYSRIDDKIQTVANVSGTKSQMQNVGEVRASGLELGLSKQAVDWLELGGDYTFTDLDNLSNSTVKLTDVPRHKLTVHALTRPLASLDVLAFAEHDSSRWASNTVRLDGFTTLNLKAAWKPVKGTTLEAGVNNLTDKNYSLADGFPSAGRSWFVNAAYQF